MKIALIAPPWYPIPPVGYGGIEIVVADLATGYQQAGNEVLLIAPGDSTVAAPLFPIVPHHLGLELSAEEQERLRQDCGRRQFQAAIEQGAQVVHDHTDFDHPRGYPLPVVRTIHGPAAERLVRLYGRQTDAGDHFVGISSRQRQLFREASEKMLGSADAIGFAGVVHNPMDVAATPFRSQKEHFALFIGRCDWEKNPDGAIRVARAAGMKLKMALRVNNYERPYFEEHVEPLLGPDVELLPEITPAQKFELLAAAEVVLFTSQWEEPFGLVMTEAGACGTPVVAFARGAAPEVIADGLTGFLVDDEDQMAAAAAKADTLDPYACRRYVEENFSPRVAAEKYVRVFEAVLAEREGGPR